MTVETFALFVVPAMIGAAGMAVYLITGHLDRRERHALQRVPKRRP